MRFSAEDGEWRVAFVFDTKPEAIPMVAGKIRKADERFAAYLTRLKKLGKKSWL